MHHITSNLLEIHHWKLRVKSDKPKGERRWECYFYSIFHTMMIGRYICSLLNVRHVDYGTGWLTQPKMHFNWNGKFPKFMHSDFWYHSIRFLFYFWKDKKTIRLSAYQWDGTSKIINLNAFTTEMALINGKCVLQMFMLSLCRFINNFVHYGRDANRTEPFWIWKSWAVNGNHSRTQKKA